MTPTAAYRMRSCKSSMDRDTLRLAARALMMKKAAVSPNTYISPYHRMAIGPSLIRTGSMSGFGSTGSHPTEVAGSFQACVLTDGLLSDKEDAYAGGWWKSLQPLRRHPAHAGTAQTGLGKIHACRARDHC